MKTSTPLHAALGLAIALLAATLAPSNAKAQQTAKVVATCGTASYTAGGVNYETIDTTGSSCGAAGTISGTVAVNVSQINGAAPSLTNPIFTAYAEAGDTTGAFTNATQTTAVTATNGDGYGTALISIHGTYGTATATFLASDDSGVTTYPLICTRSDNTASEIGYTTLTNTNRQWSCPISGNDTVVVQSSAVASGTVNVRISIVAAPNAVVVPVTAAAAAITSSISASSSATSLIAKAAPGSYSDAYCQSTAAGRCIIYNATSVPGGGALTAALVLECAVVPAGGSGAIQYNDGPRLASVGIVVLMSASTDCNTYTASSTAYIHASVQ